MESCSFLQAILLMLPPTELPSRSLMGFCYLSPLLERVKATHKHFSTRPTAIFIASFPKTGTTWLKCLLFSIASNHQKEVQKRLLSTHTHLLVRNVELTIFDKTPVPNISIWPEPRLFSTHIPCGWLHA
ncbi:hypothetical protein AMTRI_Chr02g256820 [Amborella trichopoda]